MLSSAIVSVAYFLAMRLNRMLLFRVFVTINLVIHSLTICFKHYMDSEIGRVEYVWYVQEKSGSE
jgi:hypothetical protein